MFWKKLFNRRPPQRIKSLGRSGLSFKRADRSIVYIDSEMQTGEVWLAIFTSAVYVDAQFQQKVDEQLKMQLFRELNDELKREKWQFEFHPELYL